AGWRGCLRRLDEYGRHAEVMRHGEVARQVLEHRAARRFHAGFPQEEVIGLAVRFRHELAAHDVEDVLKGARDAEPPGDPLGVWARAVGEDELASRQLADRLAQPRIRLD